MRRLVLTLFAILAVIGVSGVEAKSAPTRYSQEVDNADEGRFRTDEGWGVSSYGTGVYEDDYRFARPSEDELFAWFRLAIPETAKYAVYARWPRVKGLNDSVPVGVETASGFEWTEVNQQRDGGRWVRVGVFEMEAGDEYSVVFSNKTGGEEYVAADAVKVVQVSSGETSSEKKKKPSSAKSSDPPVDAEGQEVVREARRWFGVPYRLGRASRTGIDCAGLTKRAYQRLGISLPHNVEEQYDYGSRVSRPAPGDLVFFKEHGGVVTHVGVATGRGTVIHASNYWGKVTETRIRYIKGYVGAKRLL